MAAYRFDYENPCHVYFVGIGGISMSGLAEILLREGFRVSGSDSAQSEFTDHLTSRGAKVYIGQRAENITDDIDCAVFTAAIRPTNPEYVACQEKGIPMLTRAELLGQMMRRYRNSIAVSGTHGKTTTTAMLSHILMEADQDPTISIGGVLPLIGGNIRVGGTEDFLLEACEYTNSFLSFYPTLEVILNIEADHLDFFKDLDDIRHSFHEFVGRLPENGTVIISSDIDRYEEIVAGFQGKVITVGRKSGDIVASEISFDEYAHPSFIPVIHGNAQDRINLHVSGEHNIYNALAAIGAALELGIDLRTIARGLEACGGAERRFEKKGEIDGVVIMDDYAHHPQEIEATMRAALRCPHERLWVVFQPHTYSRTKALLPDFARALSMADRVVLAEIYPARETDTLGVSSADVAEQINRVTPGKAVALPNFDKIETYLLENLSTGDLCITMGAGDVYKVGEHLLGRGKV